jgi:hypothetical protein
MKARYAGVCANCGARLWAGTEIYYSQRYAYCVDCGTNKFEPQLTQGTLPIPKDEPVKDTASTPVAKPTVTMPLTTQACYCKLVKRKCGVCVASEMAAKAS